MSGRKIPEDIIDMLAKTFKTETETDTDSHARIIYFLSKALAENIADPFMSSLQAVKDIPDVFRKVAERLAEDTKTAEEDPKFRQLMYDVWNNFLKDNLLPDADGGRKLELAIPSDAITATTQYAFMRAVYRLSPQAFTALRSFVHTSSGPVARFTGRALAVARTAQPVIKVALVAVFLAVDIIRNIRRWWNGEITGKRCVKNIIDYGVAVAAGIAGGIGGEAIGATIGAMGGPLGIAVGAVVGGMAGGIASTIAAQTLCDNLTQWLFGLPKSEALENAYNFLGVSATASNSEINSCFRQLSLKYHPDKGGDRDGWTRLQYSLAVIKEARGE